MKTNLLILSMLLLLATSSLQAQPHLAALSKPGKTCVELRWAPLDFEAWQHGNKNGYLIERSTILKNACWTCITNKAGQLLKGKELKDYPAWEQGIDRYNQFWQDGFMEFFKIYVNLDSDNKSNEKQKGIWLPVFFINWRKKFYAKHKNASKIELYSLIIILVFCLVLFIIFNSWYQEYVILYNFTLVLPYIIAFVLAAISYKLFHMEILYYLIAAMVSLFLFNWTESKQNILKQSTIDNDYYLTTGQITDYYYLGKYASSPYIEFRLNNVLPFHKKNNQVLVNLKNPGKYIGSNVLVKHSLKSDYCYITQYNIPKDTIDKYSTPIIYYKGEKIGKYFYDDIILHPEFYYKNTGLYLIYSGFIVDYDNEVLVCCFYDIAQRKHEIKVKRTEIPDSIMPDYLPDFRFWFFHCINHKNDITYGLCPWEFYNNRDLKNWNYGDGILFNDTIYTLSKVERQCPQIKKYLNDYIKRNSVQNKKYNKKN